MVSNTLGMSLDDLVATLGRIRAEYADDPEYRDLRAQFPADWPL